LDIYLGVIANAAMVIVGTAIGCIFKGEKLKRVGERIFHAYALFVICMGVNGAADLSHPLIILVSLIIGTAIGELVDLDKQFTRFGNWAQAKFVKNTEDGDSKFARGFIEASLLFCIGSMTFMGAMESALSHSHTIYLTKGVLDGISAITLAMGFGVGTGLSAVGVLLYQGLLVSLAALLSGVLTTQVVSLCCVVGSLFLVAIGLNMLGLTKIKVANFLPAMFMPIFIAMLPFVEL